MRGHKLLKDKRDELMRQFLELVRENKALREKVEAGIAAANQNFVLACSGMTDEALNVALMAPKQEVLSGVRDQQRHERGDPGVPLQDPDLGRKRYLLLRICVYFSDLDGAVKSLADLLPDMLRLAEIEKSCQLMAAEIEKTRRRVNALERDDSRRPRRTSVYHHEAG